MDFMTLFPPVLAAFAACCGFAVIYNIHGAGVALCGLGGALGWLVYLLCAPICHGPIAQSFAAALTISAYAEWMARRRRCPVSSYLLVAFLPLVPGGGIYYTMVYAINGQTALFVSKGAETLGIAGAMALGVMLVSSFVRTGRAVVSWRRQRH